MDHVLTLIAPAGDLTQDALAQLRDALAPLGADSAAPVWLAEGRAADIPFTGISPGQADAATRACFEGRAIDIVAQVSADRRKRLLVADMDSTMVIGETLDELADFAGLKDRSQRSYRRHHGMNGEIDFPTALRERVGLLKGLSTDALEKTWQRTAFMPGAKTLVATMKAHGAYAVLVSGGFHYFTGRVRDYCGFDRDLANQLLVADGKLTGQVGEPILDREAKLKTLMTIAGERRLPLSLTLAVGDGANDLAMIQAAGLGVAYHAKPVVAAEARARIDHGDLTALLFLQGYREDEFVL